MRWADRRNREGNEQALKDLSKLYRMEMPPQPGALAPRMRGLGLAARFVLRVFPEVDRELGRWRQRLEAAGDPELRLQGLDSISRKRFHAQGGSIYALCPAASSPPAAARSVVQRLQAVGIGRGHPRHSPADNGGQSLAPFIVAFQTISDYLDNLCDRAGCLDTAAFRQLHLAYTGALDPDGGSADYYRFYPRRDDGGYLQALVDRCRQALRGLASYSAVQDEVLWLARLYADLQTFKHASPPLRQGLLRDWFAAHAGACPDLYWWEFAAATGSTLGIFALCAAAGGHGLTPEAAGRLAAGYFPWITGLHILLDYFIDQAEDEAGGDFNFVSCYAGDSQCRERLLLFFERALEQAAGLPDPLFHTTIVHGLPAFYLSDSKVAEQGLGGTADVLLAAGGAKTLSMYRACRLLRQLGKL
jgi:tetraprenyl-beta-curcumene synthase